MPFSKSLTSTLFAATFLLVNVAALADDIVPPGWTRYAPFTTVQEWDFDTSGSIAPDGDLLTFSPGVPTATPGAGLTYPALGDIPVAATDYLATFGIGNVLSFHLPNVPDSQPVKHLQIQINGVWATGFEPTVTLLIGSIPPDPDVPGVFVDSDETFPGFHRVEDWDIFPNPDFERLELTIPVGSFVNQVVIDTISVPIPAALPLFLSGLALLSGLLRIRRTTIA